MQRSLVAAWFGPVVCSICLTKSAAARAILPAYPKELNTQLQDGDLIFIRMANPIFRRVAQTTGSWENHVGIIFSGTNGSWQVAESKFPRSKFSQLDHFVARSEHGRFCILRYHEGLTPAEKLALRQSAEARMGIRYDLGFNYDSARLYCSKFAFEVYREATGYQVGKVETFGQLLANHPQAPLGFWRAWFFGFIPWERRCVTTTSELQSPELITVLDASQKAGN